MSRSSRLLPLLGLAAIGSLVAVAAAGHASAARARPAAVTAELTYVDKATDKVGTGSTAKPDQRPDGHFRFVVTGNDTIRAITLRTADASGKPCCGQVWNTVPNDSWWILGVFRNGTQLNPTDKNVSIPVSGTTTLDLYGSDSGYFKSGQRFVATVDLGSGGTVNAVAGAISGTGGGGGGGSTTTGGAAPPPTATTTGTVLVNGRPFTSGTIPYNSTVDVTRGRLALTADVGTLTVNGAGGISAVFKLLRGTDGKKPVVELRLVKGNFTVCPKRKTSSATGTATTIVRQLWGDGHGTFRTRGRYSSATVSGTNWLTADRCDGTQTRVVRGVVRVADFPRRRVVTLRPGRSYLAKP